MAEAGYKLARTGPAVANALASARKMVFLCLRRFRKRIGLIFGDVQKNTGWVQPITAKPLNSVAQASALGTLVVKAPQIWCLFQGTPFYTSNPGLKPWAILYHRFAVEPTDS